jgi:hypothetical protein
VAFWLAANKLKEIRLANPVAFISYSWTSPVHEDWVMNLATQLVQDGVEIKLDKWDLRPGHDAYKYMESMVTDPTVTKVIVISDKAYAEKADNRKGGVGTESQIMSPEIYKKADQTKFVAVVSELDQNGEPYLPKFFSTRLYVDMSESRFAANYEQLLRWLFDKPTYIKPPLGKMPEFLNQERANSELRWQARRTIDVITSSAGSSTVSTNNYLESLAAGFEAFRISRKPDVDFGQAVIDSIDSFLPARNEFLAFLRAAAPVSTSDLSTSLQRFFETIIPFMSNPESISQWYDSDFDNYVFIIHELFLYTIATLLKYERFETIAEFLSLRFFVQREESRPQDVMHPFTIIRKAMKALGPKQQELRRISLRADLLKQRSQTSGLNFPELMQADFVLFLRGATETGHRPWYPETLLYTTLAFRGPFEVFARAESRAYFARLSPVINLKSKQELEQLIQSYSTHGEVNKRWLPHWEYHALEIEPLANATRLQSRP